MLYIDINSSNIQDAKKAHHKATKCRVMRKLGELGCENHDCKICNSKKISYKSNKKIFNKIKKFILQNDHLDQILIGTPDQLELVNKEFFQNVLTKYQYERLTNYYNCKSLKVKKKQYKAGISLLTF